MKISSDLKERSGLGIIYPNKVQSLSEAMGVSASAARMTMHLGGSQMVGLPPSSGLEKIEAVNDANVFWIRGILEISQMGTLPFT